MQFLDPNHPFFRNPLARWATILLPSLWGVFEFLTGHPGWGILFLAAGAYALWVLVIGPSRGR
ncbi:hypothetical protein E7811_16655 [Aliigemmobacter aestuarii]|uniref:DUF3329 domain-containing protein n=1 Tax=Aliigemmobacter aestuarii TaxID=1445661 RepID=A0A4S3MJD0_9RHOB|nr:hypothetical protein [Gemmobacter aestuarii]THD81535.1 hypothetical protein E7811_16655 [Gemmobacter aestuarii]